jgi:hypothetical protein
MSLPQWAWSVVAATAFVVCLWRTFANASWDYEREMAWQALASVCAVWFAGTLAVMSNGG